MKLREGMKCDIDDLTAIYADRKVAQAVLDSATEHGTIADIESGKCTLPDPVDAKEFERQKRIAAAFGKSALGKAMSENPILHEYLDTLTARVAALEQPHSKQSKKGDA